MATDTTLPDDEFLTVAEIAKNAKISVRQVRRWISSGDLIAHKFGRLVRVSRRDWELFLRQRRGL